MSRPSDGRRMVGNEPLLDFARDFQVALHGDAVGELDRKQHEKYYYADPAKLEARFAVVSPANIGLENYQERSRSAARRAAPAKASSAWPETRPRPSAKLSGTRANRGRLRPSPHPWNTGGSSPSRRKRTGGRDRRSPRLRLRAARNRGSGGGVAVRRLASEWVWLTREWRLYGAMAP